MSGRYIIGLRGGLSESVTRRVGLRLRGERLGKASHTGLERRWDGVCDEEIDQSNELRR